MAIEKPPLSPTSSTTSEDWQFTSLSKLERQSLLDKDDDIFNSSYPSSPITPVLAPARSTAFLDGVRGVAALLVYLHHLSPHFFFEAPAHGFGQKDPLTGERWTCFASLPLIRLFYTGGDAAVAIFFVLSGYVLTISPLTKMIHLIRDGGGSTDSWRNTLRSLVSATIRRPIRLYLPAFITTLLYAVLRHVPGVGPLTSFPLVAASVSEELSSASKAFVHFFNPFQQHAINREWFSYGVVVWTIPIELKGSFLVFGLTALYAFAAQSRFYRRLYFFQLILLAGMLLLINQWTMSLFVAGMVLALCDIFGLGFTSLPVLSRSLAFRRAVAPVVDHFCLVAGLYLLSQPSHKSSINYSLQTPGWNILTRLTPRTYLTTRPDGEISWFDAEYFRFWTSIGGVFLLYAILRITWLQRLFAKKAPMYLGRISFMFYLTHVTSSIVLMQYFHRATGMAFGAEDMGAWWFDGLLHLPEWGFVGFNARYALALGLQLPVCIAVAHVLTPVVDGLAVRLARGVSRVLRLDGGAEEGSRRTIGVERGRSLKKKFLNLASKEQIVEKIRERRLA